MMIEYTPSQLALIERIKRGESILVQKPRRYGWRTMLRALRKTNTEVDYEKTTNGNA